MQINVELLVFKKLERLFRALLNGDYFSTAENALAYIKEIRSFIESLHELRHHPTSNNRYGNYYASYKANRHTTWYILFDVSGEKYIVRNLINNHTSDYPTFIASLK